MPLPSAPSTSASGPRQVEVVDRARRVLGGADDADVALLQLVQRARQVGDHEVRHRLGGAARDLGDGRVDADRVVLRRDHRMRAGAVGHAQAGAEVVRVGDAVEHQHQRRPFDARRACRRATWPARSGSTRADHALVPVRAGELRQALVVALDELDAGLDRALDEVRMRASRRAGSTCSSSTERGAVFRRTPTAWKPNRMRAVIGRIVAGRRQLSRPSSQADRGHAADQHRLVQHVEGEAPAAEQRRAARSGRGSGPASQRGGARSSQSAGGRAPPHDAEPGQHRHVVLGHRQVRDEADPVGPARLSKNGCCTSCGRGDRDQRRAASSQRAATTP